MIQITQILYILISIIIIIWMILRTWAKGKRIPTGIEFCYCALFGVVLILAAFPRIFEWVQKYTPFTDPINVMIIIAIIVSYMTHFKLYEKTEKQRMEITELTRQIALSQKKNK